MRYFLISILLHVMVISFCWVGFSVPIGRDQNSFTYLGTLSTIGQTPSRGVLCFDSSQHGSKHGECAEPQYAPTKDFGTVEESAAYFTPWLKMREVGKPHVHLGL